MHEAYAQVKRDNNDIILTFFVLTVFTGTLESKT